MSEIKGQILGIILVLTIFGVVATALKGVFNNLKDTVVETVTDIEGEVKPSSSYMSIRNA